MAVDGDEAVGRAGQGAQAVRRSQKAGGCSAGVTRRYFITRVVVVGHCGGMVQQVLDLDAVRVEGARVVVAWGGADHEADAEVGEEVRVEGRAEVARAAHVHPG